MVKEMGQTSVDMLPMAPLAIQYINQLILLLSSPQYQLVLRQFDRFTAKCQRNLMKFSANYANHLVN